MGHTPQFETRLAQSQADLEASQRLRYNVFVRELGAAAAGADHVAGLERDSYDPHLDHLLLLDHARTADPVVGVYRLLRGDQRDDLGQFYTEAEFDLGAILASGRRLLELGRSCLHMDYRGGAAMYHLWQGIATYVEAHQIDILFGVASFRGTDPHALAEPLSNLHYAHLAPESLRPRASPYNPMNLLPAHQVNRPAAIKATPSLIKAYLRLGGVVGDGAYVDHDFNTTDVCLVLDMHNLSDRHRDIYSRTRAAE